MKNEKNRRTKFFVATKIPAKTKRIVAPRANEYRRVRISGVNVEKKEICQSVYQRLIFSLFRLFIVQKVVVESQKASFTETCIRFAGMNFGFYSIHECFMYRAAENI